MLVILSTLKEPSMSTKKLLSFFYFLAFIGIVGALYSFTTKSLEAKTSFQTEWENLKVLPEDISKDSLENLMKGYSKALGVNCSYCHTPQDDNPKKLDFADDGKDEKEFARHMIEMTRKINKENFDWEDSPEPEKINVVTCTMCHRGNPQPSNYLKNSGYQYLDKDEQKYFDEKYSK